MRPSEKRTPFERFYRSAWGDASSEGTDTDPHEFAVQEGIEALAIGPQSDADACVVFLDSAQREGVVVSRERPLIAHVPPGTRLGVYPYRQVGNAAASVNRVSTPYTHRLDLMGFPSVPPVMSDRRAPRRHSDNPDGGGNNPWNASAVKQFPSIAGGGFDADEISTAPRVLARVPYYGREHATVFLRAITSTVNWRLRALAIDAAGIVIKTYAYPTDGSYESVAGGDSAIFVLTDRGPHFLELEAYPTTQATGGCYYQLEASD